MAIVDRTGEFCQLNDTDASELQLRDARDRELDAECRRLRHTKLYDFRWKAGTP